MCVESVWCAKSLDVAYGSVLIRRAPLLKGIALIYICNKVAYEALRGGYLYLYGPVISLGWARLTMYSEIRCGLVGWNTSAIGRRGASLGVGEGGSV